MHAVEQAELYHGLAAYEEAQEGGEALQPRYRHFRFTHTILWEIDTFLPISSAHLPMCNAKNNFSLLSSDDCRATEAEAGNGGPSMRYPKVWLSAE